MVKKVIWIGLAIVLFAVVVFAVGVVVQKWRTSGTESTDQTQQLNQERLQAIVVDPAEKILVFSSPSTATAATVDLYISPFTSADSAARVIDDMPKRFSNFNTATNTWLTVSETTIQRHSWTTIESVGTITLPVTTDDAASYHPVLAYNAAGTMAAWVTTQNQQQHIVLFDLNSGSETIVYSGASGEKLNNVSWSPLDNELAFVRNNSVLVTVDLAGAQLFNSIEFPFTDISWVEWIEPDRFGVVVTSAETNPSPFSPKLVVFDRAGLVIEEHDVFNKVGAPRVVWSADKKYFLFHNPWQNTFLIYDRFNNLQQRVSVKAPDKLTPFGWVAGDTTRRPQSTTTTTDPADPVTASATPFTVTADEWDRYNSTIRSILNQFEVNFNNYRFSTASDGIEISANLGHKQKHPEFAFLQTLLQIFAVSPDIPAISLQLTDANDQTLTIIDFTRYDAEQLVDQFTAQPIDQLFIISREHPIGIKTPKSDQPQHNYLSDLVFSNFGDYNPGPALAFIGTELTDKTTYWSDSFSLTYPPSWQRQDMFTTVGSPYRSGDILFYTTETSFLSPASWSGFAVLVRSYAVPVGGLEEWLFVNRNDQTVEETDLVFHLPVEGKHVIKDNAYSDEYVLYANHTAYVFTIERQPELTATDRDTLQQLIQSFTDHYAFSNR